MPQRKDVDSFYGTKFEGEFERIQYKDAGLSVTDIIADSTLSQKLRPTFFLDGRPVEYVWGSEARSSALTPIDLEGEGEVTIPLALKMSPEEVLAAAGRRWEIGYERDLRLPVLVSAIKAAHLTCFYLLGYRYAFRTSGLLRVCPIRGTSGYRAT